MPSRNQNSAPITPELPFGENFTDAPSHIASNDEVLAAYQRGSAYAQQVLMNPETQQLPLPRPTPVVELDKPQVPQHIQDLTAELHAKAPNTTEPRELSQRQIINDSQMERLRGEVN